jgi:cell division protease FtsH
VDEIDAVGRHRGAGLGGGHDEREQTLNQILVEMDGFDTGTNVIVMAATNRPDILDPALLRPGRFDRRVILDNPDLKGRKEILGVHSKGKPLDEDVDLERVARQTVGFSGADLANLVNEAAILTARRMKKLIGISEFSESIDRVTAGPERRSRVITDHEKEVTAYHESGHALVAHVLPDADPVAKVTIIARGQAGGYTKTVPEEDRHLITRNQLEAKLAMAMGGRAAEELVFGDITTGATNDLEQATNIARTMVTRFGMSEKLGPRTFGKREELIFLGREISEQRDYSDSVAEQIDDEVHSLIDGAYQTAMRILKDHRPRLDHISNYLMENETIEEDQFPDIFDNPTAPAPMPAD